MKILFADLPVRRFRKGQILIYEGDPVKSVYFLENGYVKVSNIHNNGTQRTIFLFAPGEMFPLVNFLAGEGIAEYFYECMTDVEVRILSRDKFKEIVHGDIELGERLIRYGYNLATQFSQRIETLTAESAQEKVARLLHYLSGKAGVKKRGKVKLLIPPLTSHDIAEMCSITRETASMQVIKLRKAGIIEGRRYLNINCDKLAEIIGQ